MALISLGEWIDRHGDEPDLGVPASPSPVVAKRHGGERRDGGERRAGGDRRAAWQHMLPRVNFLRLRKRLRARHGVHIVDLSSGCEIAGTRTRLL